MNLPTGAFLHISPLPADYTAEQLSDLLYQHGVDCAPERCSVRVKQDFAYAVVSIPTETTGDLVTWALNHAAPTGKEIVVAKLIRPSVVTRR